MSKHTPAPWKAGKFNNYEYFDIESKDGRITSIYAGIESDPTAEANAHLIAAAPELLSTLEDCITDENACCFATSDLGYMVRRLKEINRIAREAINKAKGNKAP